MKFFYPLATFCLATLLFTNQASAQTFTGGTYTASRNGNWTNPAIWSPSAPSNNCLNCEIIISPGVTVILNTNVNLHNGSQLVVGTASSIYATSVVIQNPSNGADYSTSYNIILWNDGTATSLINLTNSNASINAKNGDNYFDGVFTTYPTTPTDYFKQVGVGYSSFSGTTPSNQRTLDASYETLSGTETLNSVGTLPVTLSAFNTVLSDGQVNLTWTTAQELNSSYFEVQRSTNGGTSWDNLGKVQAQGVSALPTNYSFTDASPVSGVDEYRLQMVDLDGKTTYSQVETIRTTVVTSLSIFPNPVRDNLNITLGGESASGDLTIGLYNLVGQLMVQRKVTNAGGTTITLPVSSYPAGNYLVRITAADGSSQSSKVLIFR